MIGPNVQCPALLYHVCIRSVLSDAIFQRCGVLVGLPAAMVHTRIHCGLYVGSLESAVEEDGGRNISVQKRGETTERYV